MKKIKAKVVSWINRSAGLLALIAAILYPTSFWICEYLYPNEGDQRWFELRDLHRGLIVCLLVIAGLLPDSKLKKASLLAFLVLCLGNLADRIIFGITEFNLLDWIIIAGAIVVFIKTIRANDTGRD